MVTATEVPRGGTTPKEKPATEKGGGRRGGWKERETGKFVSKQKALDTLSA